MMPVRPEAKFMNRSYRTGCFIAALWALVAGCAANGSVPLEYLDEHTAASITVVSKPMAFAHPRASVSANVTEFASVTAVAVDRDGKRDYLLVTHVWATAGPDRGSADAGATYELVADGHRIGLGDRHQALEDFAVSVPVQTAAGIAMMSALTHTDLATLQSIATAHSLAVESSGGAPYALFNDGRASLAQFVRHENGER
jgi:hypothetical protein